MNGFIIIIPKTAPNHSFYSQNYDSNTNHFSVAIGFAWAYKNPSVVTDALQPLSHTHMERCNWISNKSDYVTELLIVGLYSNNISGITDDVNTIYLCKRTMKHLFVKEQSFID